MGRRSGVFANSLLTSSGVDLFTNIYTDDLTKRTKWCQDGRQVVVGDIVIIVDEFAPRNRWEKAIVEQVHSAPDGRVRTATVRTSTAIRKRLVSKLAVLDVK
jgi:hypothetical protein